MRAGTRTLDRSMFGRAQGLILQVPDEVRETNIGDAKGAAKQLQGLLLDKVSFKAEIDPSLIRILGRAAEKAMKMPFAPDAKHVAMYVSSFASRLEKDGGPDKRLRAETARFCGYIATSRY